MFNEIQNLKNMKTLTKLLLAIACICLLSACSKSDILNDDNLSGNDLKCAKAHPRMVTLPFNVHYLSSLVSMDPDARCGDPPYYRIINEGPGNGTVVGKSFIHFDFCFNVDTYVYGNDTPSVNGKYFMYIVAANGDSLYINLAGHVIPGRLPDMPSYVIDYFKDPFEILGGTGRFKGATGHGMTDDYDSSLDPRTYHHWVGIITMLKGK